MKKGEIKDFRQEGTKEEQNILFKKYCECGINTRISQTVGHVIHCGLGIKKPVAIYDYFHYNMHRSIPIGR